MKWYVILIIVLVVMLGYIVIKYVPSYLMAIYLEKKAKEVIEERSGILTIEVRDEQGYLIHVPDGKTTHSIKWTDVKKIELSKGDIELVIYRLDVVDTINANTSSGFLNLIKAVPAQVPMNDKLIAFKQNYFADLKCCDICGKVSVRQGDCLRCGSLSYEQYIKNNELMGIVEDEGKKEYVKREQLFWFYDEGRINFFDDYFLFKRCSNWKPSVTEAEVVKYGTEE